MGIIYIDSLFLINFLADYVLLLAAARVSAIALRRKRYLAAALLGAVLSVAAVVPGFYFLGGGISRLAIAAVMGLIAYGRERERIRCTAVFLAVAASFGGTAAALGAESMSLPVLIAAFGGCYALLTLISLYKAKLHTKKTCRVALGFLGRQVELAALIDSGNCLSDPVSGADILIVRAAALREVFRGCEALLEITDPVDFISAAEGFIELRGKFRLIPYSALGGGGMLPVFRPECVTVDGKARDSLLCGVAAALDGSGFDAII